MLFLRLILLLRDQYFSLIKYLLISVKLSDLII